VIRVELYGYQVVDRDAHNDSNNDKIAFYKIEYYGPRTSYNEEGGKQWIAEKLIVTDKEIEETVSKMRNYYDARQVHYPDPNCPGTSTGTAYMLYMFGK
jgi:hypothetical protein